MKWPSALTARGRKSPAPPSSGATDVAGGTDLAEERLGPAPDVEQEAIGIDPVEVQRRSLADHRTRPATVERRAAVGRRHAQGDSVGLGRQEADPLSIGRPVQVERGDIAAPVDDDRIGGGAGSPDPGGTAKIVIAATPAPYAIAAIRDPSGRPGREIRRLSPAWLRRTALPVASTVARLPSRPIIAISPLAPPDEETADPADPDGRERRTRIAPVRSWSGRPARQTCR